MEDIEGIMVDILESSTTNASETDSEDSSIEEDEQSPEVIEEEYSVYKVNFWPAKPDAPKGYTFKGKSKTMTFIVGKIKNEMKKGTEKEMDNVKFKVLDNRIVGGATQVMIEMNDKEGRGNAIADFWGPNKRKECTIMIKKSREHEERYVTILAKSIIQPLLDCFISGDHSGSLFRNSKPINTKKKQKTENKCKICEKKLSSQKYLKVHMERMHVKEDSKIDAHDAHKMDEIESTGKNEDVVVDTITKTSEYLESLEKESFEEKRVDDTFMDVADDEKKTEESDELIERSKFRDEQIKMKEKRRQEKDENYKQKKKEEESLKKLKEEKEKVEKRSSKNRKQKKRKLSLTDEIKISSPNPKQSSKANKSETNSTPH